MLFSNGKFMDTGRNEPCPCGSGKKYKKCCLTKDEDKARLDAREARERALQAAREAEEKAKAEREAQQEAWRTSLPPAAASVWDRGLAAEADAATGDGDEEGSDDDFPETAGDDGEESPFPQVDLTLPKLAPEDQTLVDAWWAQVEPLWTKEDWDPREIQGHVIAFLETHPRLFVHLHLDDELIFSLGGEYARRREWGTYAQLLLRLRREQPQMYVRSHQYFDFDVIVELILQGRQVEIPAYLNYFKQYPDSDADMSSHLVDLLAWCGLDAALFDLGETVSSPLLESPKVIGGDFVARWLVFRECFHFLDARDSSPEAERQLADRLNALRIPNVADFSTEPLGLCLRWANDEVVKPLVLAVLGAKERGYYELTWRFCRFLHDRKGLSWLRARFLADAFFHYGMWARHGNKVRDVLELKKPVLDAYLAQHCRLLTTIQGVQAYATLQSAAAFTDFMVATQTWNADKAKMVHQTCAELFELVSQALASNDPAPRLYPDFAALCRMQPVGVPVP